jgi:hypothetical protein
MVDADDNLFMPTQQQHSRRAKRSPTTQINDVHHIKAAT